LKYWSFFFATKEHIDNRVTSRVETEPREGNPEGQFRFPLV
jgi:hypothetical protein